MGPESAFQRGGPWRGLMEAEKDAVELELPSGMKILARPLDPAQLLAWDELPLGLAATVQGGGQAATGTSDVLRGVKLFREVLVYCCVKPRIADRAVGEDEIAPWDIPQDDWLFIVRWAMRGKEADALRTFVTGEKMLAVAVTAKVFGQRPSTLVGIDDRMTALEFDLAAAAVLAMEEKGEYSRDKLPVERICL